MPRVKLFANFREAAGVKEIEIEAEKLSELLRKLAETFPKLGDVMFEGGKLREYVNIMVNGRIVRGEDVELKDDDEVAIFPPISGG
ncbi:MAG: ubiquitin-like small modifier protein 1 [Archaeoglobaceae archaeon]